MYSSCGRLVKERNIKRILFSLLRISLLGDLSLVLVDNTFEMIALQTGGL